MNVNIISCFAPNTGSEYSRMKIAEYTNRGYMWLCNQKELLEVLELNVREDHIQYVIWIAPSIPYHPSWGISRKARSQALPEIWEPGKMVLGRHLWARGYCVSAIGLDEAQIRSYVRVAGKTGKRNWAAANESTIELKSWRLSGPILIKPPPLAVVIDFLSSSLCFSLS